MWAASRSALAYRDNSPTRREAARHLSALRSKHSTTDKHHSSNSDKVGEVSIVACSTSVIQGELCKIITMVALNSSCFVQSWEHCISKYPMKELVLPGHMGKLKISLPKKRERRAAKDES